MRQRGFILRFTDGERFVYWQRAGWVTPDLAKAHVFSTKQEALNLTTFETGEDVITVEKAQEDAAKQ